MSSSLSILLVGGIALITAWLTALSLSRGPGARGPGLRRAGLRVLTWILALSLLRDHRARALEAGFVASWIMNLALLVLGLMVLRIEGLDFRRLGLLRRSAIKDFSAGAGLGFGLALILIQNPALRSTSLSPNAGLLASLVAILLLAFNSELIFRVVLPALLRARLPNVAALALGSLALVVSALGLAQWGPYRGTLILTACAWASVVGHVAAQVLGFSGALGASTAFWALLALTG